MSNSLFDVIVSNPPYQEETAQRATGRSTDRSIYPSFIVSSISIASCVLMIHPRRSFVVNTRTDKQVVETLKNDPLFKIMFFYEDNRDVFPEADIKGGIVVTSYHENNTHQWKDFDDLIPDPLIRLRNNAHKLQLPSITGRIHLAAENTLQSHIVEKYELKNKKLNTNIIDKIPDVFNSTYGITVVGRRNNKRTHTAIQSGDIVLSDTWKNNWKVIIPVSHGGKRRGSLGKMEILAPGEIATSTFLAFDAGSTRTSAENLMRYINNVCVRALLSIKKITQHGNRDTWVYVPDIGCYEDNNGAINWEEDITEQMYELLDVSAEDREWLTENVG